MVGVWRVLPVALALLGTMVGAGPGGGDDAPVPPSPSPGAADLLLPWGHSDPMLSLLAGKALGPTILSLRPSPYPAIGSPRTVPPTDCVPHPSVMIEGDAGAMGLSVADHPVTGAPIANPSSGIVSGSGTAEDPYVISGWCFTGPPSSRLVEGITMRQTNAHVVIEGNWFGNLRAGIALDRSTNVTVRDNIFVGVRQGLLLVQVQASFVEGNIITDVGDEAFSLHRSDGNAIVNNTVGAWLAGNTGSTAIPGTVLWLEQSHGNRIAGNTFSDAVWGVDAFRSGPNEILGNSFRGMLVDILIRNSTGMHVGNNLMEQGIGLGGGTPAELQHTIHPSNLVRGAPLRYVAGAEDHVVPSDAGQVIVVLSRNVTVRHQTIPAIPYGIQAYSSQNLSITDNQIAAFGMDILATDVHGSKIARNDLSEAFWAILMYESSENDIHANHIQDAWSGMSILLGSNDNIVQGNVLRDLNGVGLYTALTSRAEFHNNAVTASGAGVLAGVAIPGYSFPAQDARIFANNLTGNGYGIVVMDGSGQVANDNNLGQNVEGGIVVSGATVDGRFNWWGCPDGPSAEGCDLASGNVAVSPWRVSPNPTSGPAGL